MLNDLSLNDFCSKDLKHGFFYLFVVEARGLLILGKNHLDQTWGKFDAV